jgi:hypothetical protein
MNTGTKNFMVGSVAVCAAVVALYFAFADRSPKLNLDPYDVLGAVTAEETAKLLGNKGLVLLIVRDTGPNKNPSVEAELKAFQETLKKQPGLATVIERIPLTPMMMMATGGGAPPDEFLKAIQTHANAGAVVLFFGFPQLTEPELQTLKQSGVKIVVVSSFRTGYKQLLERQAIHLAVVPRSDAPPPGTQTPRTLRERFDQLYTTFTPADTARLP